MANMMDHAKVISVKNAFTDSATINWSEVTS